MSCEQIKSIFVSYQLSFLMLEELMALSQTVKVVVDEVHQIDNFIISMVDRVILVRYVESPKL